MSNEPREIKIPAGKTLLSTLIDRAGKSTASPLHLAPDEAVILDASA
jgi:hypothetical protein